MKRHFKLRVEFFSCCLRCRTETCITYVHITCINKHLKFQFYLAPPLLYELERARVYLLRREMKSLSKRDIWKVDIQRRWTWTGDFKCREVKTGFCRKRWTQTGSSGTLIGWKSGQTTFIPLWDRMEGAWLWTLARPADGEKVGLQPESIEWFIEDQAFSPSCDLVPPPPPSPPCSVCISSTGEAQEDWEKRKLVNEEGRGGGGSAKSYDDEKAWSSINYLYSRAIAIYSGGVCNERCFLFNSVLRTKLYLKQYLLLRVNEFILQHIFFRLNSVSCKKCELCTVSCWGKLIFRKT